jgi:hypothetical protein
MPGQSLSAWQPCIDPPAPPELEALAPPGPLDELTLVVVLDAPPDPELETLVVVVSPALLELIPQSQGVHVPPGRQLCPPWQAADPTQVCVSPGVHAICCVPLAPVVCGLLEHASQRNTKATTGRGRQESRFDLISKDSPL